MSPAPSATARKSWKVLPLWPGSSSAAAAAAAADEWATRLVNAANPLPEDFSVKTVDIEGYENRPFDARAATALEEMLADAEQPGTSYT